MRWSNLFRFRLQTVFIFMLGIAVGYALNLQTLRILFGPPTEAHMTRLPTYVIEPPDILLIEADGQFTAESAGLRGQYLVGPDGRINLDKFGSLSVSGLTIEEAREAVGHQLELHGDVESVFVDVMAYNSKFYYVIVQGQSGGNTITKVPITGNETVLDAIACIGGMPSVSNVRLWVNRPTANGLGSSQLLPVSWEEIADGSSTSTNYQLLPGDRLFISQRPRKSSK